MADELTRCQIADEHSAAPCRGNGDRPDDFSRRVLLRTAGAGAAVAAVAVAAAACGNSSNNPANPANAAANGAVTVSTSRIPLNGGEIIASAQIVITQPAAGTYKAFSAICTHQGCTVAAVAHNVIQCPCHGSLFSASDGSVIQGPAQAPLAAKNITVSNGQITAS
jgi:Rieske Fe-S protein